MSYRAWTSLEAATRCKSLVVFKQGVCIFHRGMANEEADPAKSSLGPICQKAVEDEKGNYLANLGLYPGKPSLSLLGSLIRIYQSVIEALKETEFSWPK